MEYSKKKEGILINLDERQNKLVEMLKILELIFKKKKCEYTLLGGSVLGAVRHKGIIPWDDDIDIGLLRSDFLTIEDYLSKNEIKGYVFERSTEHYIPDAPIAKFKADMGLGEKNPTIDIFALDNAPNTKNLQKLQVIYGNFYNLINYGEIPENRGYFGAIISRIILLCFNGKFKRRGSDFFYQKMTQWNLKDTDYITNLFGYPNRKELFQKKIILERKLVGFCDLKCPIPIFYDEYLSQLYGEYLIIPPEAKRRPKHV